MALATGWTLHAWRQADQISSLSLEALERQDRAELLEKKLQSASDLVDRQVQVTADIIELLPDEIVLGNQTYPNPRRRRDSHPTFGPLEVNAR